MDFSRLPNEILDKIQDYVSSRSRALLRRSCRRMDAVVKKAREAKKRVYYLGFSFDETISKLWLKRVPIFADALTPVIFEETCDYRFLSDYQFPKVCLKTLKLDENPRRVVQQTLEKYPNVDVINLQRATIDETVFEIFESVGVRLSQISMLHFQWCEFVVPLCSLHKWFSQIRLVCLEMCTIQLNRKKQVSNDEISRFLYYGEDSTSQPYDIAEWTVRGSYLSPYHAICLIKTLIKKEDVAVGTYTLPRIFAHRANIPNCRPERKVDFLAAIETFKKLGESEGCSVTVHESTAALLYCFKCEYTKIVIEKLTEKGSLEINLLVAYCFGTNDDDGTD